MSRAWVLINTSIHEGLPVSMCEALRVGTPLLSTVDPAGLASRYGVFAGEADGAGSELLEALDDGLRTLIEGGDRRRELGADASAWALANHSVAAFGERLVALLDQAGAGSMGRVMGAAVEARLESGRRRIDPGVRRVRP